MKKIMIGAFLLFGMNSLSIHVVAQSNTVKTDTITVSGNCGQCKERIEEAAFIKGVKQAEWNKKTHLLTVTYNSSKTNLELVAGAVSRSGHDSRLSTAPESSYKKLPSCCAYRTGTCHHE